MVPRGELNSVVKPSQNSTLTEKLPHESPCYPEPMPFQNTLLWASGDREPLASLLPHHWSSLFASFEVMFHFSPASARHAAETAGTSNSYLGICAEIPWNLRRLDQLALFDPAQLSLGITQNLSFVSGKPANGWFEFGFSYKNLKGGWRTVVFCIGKV